MSFLLTIAGHDPVHGAGITADLATWSHMGLDGASVVTASARGASLTGGEATISIASRSQRVPILVSASSLADATTRATGRLTLSLDRLGVKPIKGPLGAFRVKDAIEVSFAIPLAPA